MFDPGKYGAKEVQGGSFDTFKYGATEVVDDTEKKKLIGTPKSSNGGINSQEVSPSRSPLPLPQRIGQNKSFADIFSSTEFLDHDISVSNALTLSNYNNAPKDPLSLQGFNQSQQSIAAGGVVPSQQEKIDNKKAQIKSNSSALKEYRQQRVDELNKEAQKLQSSKYTVGPFGAAKVVSDEEEAVLDNSISSVNDYKKQLKESVSLTANKIIPKEVFDEKGSYDLQEIGYRKLKTVGDTEVDDDVKVLSTIGKVDANKEDIDRTKQNIQYKLYREGAIAAKDYFASLAEEARSVAADKIFKIDELVDLREASTNAPESKAAYDAAISRLLEDDEVKAYSDAVLQATKYATEANTAADKFPQVKRQQLRQQLNDKFFDIIQNRNESRNFLNPITPLRLAAGAILGEEPDEKDIAQLAKETGISEDEVRNVIKTGGVGGAFANAQEGVRIAGGLTGIAQGVDETIANSLMGIKRWAGLDNVDAKNRILSDRSEGYKAGAAQNKLLDNGNFNINPYSIFNTMGSGIGQTSVYAVPGLAGGAAAGRIGQAIGTVAAGYAGSYEGAYKEAAKYTTDEELRRSYANVTAFENALPELILSPADIAKKLAVGKVGGEAAFKAFATEAAEKGTAATVAGRLGKFSKEFGEVVLAENIEEQITNVTNNITQADMLGVEKTGAEWLKQAFETGVVTTLTTLPLGIGAGVNAQNDVSGIRKETIFEIGNEPETYIPKLEALRDNGTITTEQFNTKIAQVKTMADVVASSNKATKADGTQLSYEEKANLAAQEYRIAVNNGLKKEGVIAAQEKLIDEDNAQAAAIQDEILRPAVIMPNEVNRPTTEVTIAPDETLTPNTQQSSVAFTLPQSRTEPNIIPLQNESTDNATQAIPSQNKEAAAQEVATEILSSTESNAKDNRTTFQRDVTNDETQAAETPLIQGTATVNESNTAEESKPSTTEVNQNQQGAEEVGKDVTEEADLKEGAEPSRLGANTDKIKRSRSNSIVFSRPIKGKNGSRLLSYTWESNEFGKDREGKPIRFSDWEKAGVNADTGRNIVHKFKVEVDGKVLEVSGDSVAKALGFTNAEMEKAFPKAKDFVKQLAKMRMREEALIDELASTDEAVAQAVKAVSEKYNINIEVYKNGDNVLASSFGMPKDDVMIGNDDASSLVRKELRDNGVYFTERRNVGQELNRVRNLIKNKKNQASQFGDIDFAETTPNAPSTNTVNTTTEDNKTVEIPEIMKSAGIIKPAKNKAGDIFYTVKRSSKWFSESNKYFKEKYGINDVLYNFQNKRSRKVDNNGYYTLEDGTRVKEAGDGKGDSVYYIQSKKFNVTDNAPSPTATNNTTEAVTNKEVPEATQEVQDNIGDVEQGNAVASASVLTQSAIDLLDSVKGGSKPTFITKNLERIARDNGITITDKKSADDIINELKAKQTKNNQNAIPKQVADEVDVRQQAKNGEAVVEGNEINKEPSKESKKKTKISKTKASSALRSRASTIREKGILPSWAKSNLPDGTQQQGFGGKELDEAVAKAFELVADAIDAGAKLGEAADRGFSSLRDYYKANTKSFDEDKLRRKFNKEVVTSVRGGGNMSGITQANTEQSRLEFGINETYERTEPRTDAQLEKEADEAIKAGYNIEALVSAIEKGKTPNDTETTILKVYVAGLEAQLEKNPTDEKIAELNRFFKAMDAIGSEQGRAFRARQGLRLRDDSLSAFFQTETEVNQDVPLTQEQKERVIKEHADIVEARKAYEKKIADLEAENAKLKAAKEVAKTKSSIPTNKNKTHEDYVKERSDIISNIKEKLRKARTGQSGLTAVPVPYAAELFAIAPDVAKLTKSLIEEGITKLADVVSNIQQTLKDEIPDITEKDVHDIIAGEYNSPRKTKNELNEQLYDLRSQAKLMNRLEQLEKGIVPKKEDEKRKRNKEIEDLKKKIRENDLTKLTAAKSRIQSEIKKVEEAIAAGQYENEKRPELKLDEEGIKLKDKLIKLKQDRQLRLLKQQYANRSKQKKLQDNILEVLNVPRTLMSSMDYSAPLRQAAIVTVAHPTAAAKAGAEMFLQSFSQKRFDRWFFDLRESPRFKLMEASGLYVADPHDPRLSVKEEAFMNNLTEKIPFFGGEIKLGKDGIKIPFTNKTVKTIGGLVKGSERAYVGYLNKMRVDLFNRFTDAYEAEGRTMDNSPELFKGLATFLNNVTGRGGLGKLESAAPILNTAFFSPRLIASRIGVLADVVSYGNVSKYPPEIKKMLYADVLRFVGVGATVLSLISLAWGCENDGGDDCFDVELDPRSSDFGKLRYNNTRWDIWAGFQQYIRIAAQTISGGTKSINSGKINELNGDGLFDRTRLGVLGGFARGKLAPIPSMGIDFLYGRDMLGEKVTIQKEAFQHLLPLGVTGMEDALKEQGIKALFTVGAPSTFGVGVQTYLPRGYEDKDVKKDTVYKFLYERNVGLSEVNLKGIPDNKVEDFKKAKDVIFKREWEQAIQYGAMLNAKGNPTTDTRNAVRLKKIETLTYDEITALMKSVTNKSTRQAKKQLGIETED